MLVLFFLAVMSSPRKQEMQNWGLDSTGLVSVPTGILPAAEVLCRP